MNTTYVRNREDQLRMPILWLAVGLSLLAAVSYLLIERQLLAVGDLQTADRPATIVLVAAACYALGALLILVRRAWLWIVGAGVNLLVILFFVLAYLGRPSVMFSPGGLVTKSAQIFLEVCLLALIVLWWRRQHSSEGGSR
jgi:hypothetical protein